MFFSEKKRNIFLLLFIKAIIFPLILGAQSTRKIDSLKLVLGKNIADSVKCKVFIDLGWRYTYVNIDSSFHYNRLALELSKRIGKMTSMASALNDIGIDHYVQGNFKKAITFLDDAFHLHQKNGDKFGMFQTKSNIGACYNLLNQTLEAVDAFKEAKALLVEMGRKELLPGIELNLAVMYLDLNKVEEAGRTIESVINESRGVHDKVMEATALSEYGNYYSRKGNLDSALKYFTAGYNILVELKQEVNSVQDLINISEIYFKKGKPDKALSYALKAVELAKNNQLYKEMGSAYGQLTYIYADLHDYKKAWESSLSFKQFSDSIFNSENSKAVSDVKTKYEVELKEAELNAKSEAEKKILIAATAAERMRKQIILLSGIAIVILISVFSIVLYKKFREANGQKQIIQLQKTEVEVKKQELETKNREVFDSIVYARNIQTALLPDKDQIRKQINDFFILFAPKDIIAGDFYWYRKIDEDCFYFAVGDCTGHGVPGALMSVLGINLLDTIYTESRSSKPSYILDELTRRIVLALQSSSETGKINDGMDISIVKFDLRNRQITAAMANNPVVIVSNNEVTQLKPDKMWIGQSDKAVSFNEQCIELKPGDTVFMFSDGYKDQFGGEKGKKLRHKDFINILVENSNHKAAVQNERLHAFLNEWKGNFEQTDDICVTGIKIT